MLPILLGAAAVWLLGRKRDVPSEVVPSLPAESIPGEGEAELSPVDPSPAVEVAPSTASQQALDVPGRIVDEVVVDAPVMSQPEEGDALVPGGDPSPAVEVAPSKASQQAVEVPGRIVDEVVVDAPPSQSAVEAARRLSRFATNAIKAGRARSQLGTEDKPSSEVREAQEAMGVVPADGIYGPATRRAMQALGAPAPVRR